MLPFLVFGPILMVYPIINGMDFELPTLFYGLSTLLPIGSAPLQVLIPGVNLNFAGSIVWTITTLLAAIFHEFGHYIAAKQF